MLLLGLRTARPPITVSFLLPERIRYSHVYVNVTRNVPRWIGNGIVHVYV